MPIEPMPWWRVIAPVVGFLLLTLVRFVSPQPRIEIIWRTCLAVIAYAMIQDQISARLSSAYFTVGHAPISGLSDPTLLGLAWGFLGGFPGGILLGLALACCATLGSPTPVPLPTVQRLLLLMVLSMAFASVCAGGSAAYNAGVVSISIGEPWAQLIPTAEQRAFFIVACTHFGTYLGATIAGVSACSWLLWYRCRPKVGAVSLAS